MSDITMGGAPGGTPGAPDSNEANGTQGGGHSVGDAGGNSSPSGSSAPILLYATMPLQIGTGLGTAICSQLDWKQFATAPLLTLCLQDASGVPINLSGAQSVTLRLKPIAFLTDVIMMQRQMRVLYASGGLVGYLFETEEVNKTGCYALDVEVVLGDGSCMYFPTTGSVLFVIHP